MVLSGEFLYIILVLLASWLALLCRALWKLVRASSPQKTRTYVTLAGIGSAALAVGSLLALHLSWVSVDISQQLGVKAIRILSLLLFWSTLTGLLLCVGGRGRVRFVGIGTCLITGLWWFSLLMTSAISMGGASIARHPTRYLIPEGYVGWVKIKHGENADPLPLLNGEYICRIPESGVLGTSSALEDGWAKDEYFYYSGNGKSRELRNTGWGRGGMIWAENIEWELSREGSRPKKFAENFYVGTEDQYHHNEGHPIHQSQQEPVTASPKS
jgi:hypothetical protein